MKLRVVIIVIISIILSSATAWAGLTKTEVSQLYVAMFGRASEGEGNAFWQSLPDMVTAATAMLDTQAAKDYFGANLNTNQAFIEHIYLNTLNKTIADDAPGISYWVSLLNGGLTRGQVSASLVGVIKDYAPGGPYYDPDNAATIAAYWQFTNRVTVSDYMADTVFNAPTDWATSTAFSSGIIVTNDHSTVDTAKAVVNDFNGNDPPTSTCGAYISPGVWKEFDCYNLAAIGKTTGDDPFTPSWRLIGGYWQWGRKGPDPSQWFNTNTSNFAHGPTGPDDGETNEGEISGWEDTSYAPDGAWSDSYITINDPCPAGFRVPTRIQWEGVLNNNTQSTIGSWSSSYSSALFFGSGLMLPAAGGRTSSSGTLLTRGGGGYWSSSQDTSDLALLLNFDNSDAYMYSYYRRLGLSVRCVADDSSPSCTYSITPSSESFTNSGGTRSIFVTASSTSCAWTASENLDWVSLSPSSGTGTGAISVTVAANTGAARSGSIIIAGQTYTITQDTGSSSSNCGAYVAPGVWKEFDCYNLAAIGKTTNDDPFTPSWRLIGGYWQWGQKGPDPSQWYNTNTPNFAHGPTGPGTSEANSGSISGWDHTLAPNGSWSDTAKTDSDPCPSGYRVTTQSQWQGVINNNAQSIVGTWSIGCCDDGQNNYSAAWFFGDDLMLPSAGTRYLGDGSLYSRGTYGLYWSSTELGSSYYAWGLRFSSGSALTFGYNERHNGFSVRCIAE